MDVVLASASPRRQELLKRLISEFTIIESDFDENTVMFSGSCPDYVMKSSFGKAMNVAEKLTEPSLVIGCDTIVSYGNTVLGKPVDYDEAFSMLSMLSGNTHQVYSGITLINTKNNMVKKEFVLTDVMFSRINDEEIRRYLESGEPMDKAGAYGIQGYGGVFVEEIHGCYYNVVGLPLNKLNKMIKGMGVNL
ncbi:MAG: Maf-like protein [Clostridiaceae bacterium]